MNICIITHGYPTPYNPDFFVFVDQLVSVWADMGLKVSVINPIPAFVECFDKKRYYKKKWEKQTLNGNKILVFSPRYYRIADRKIGCINTQKISYKGFQHAVERTIHKMPEKPDILYAHFLSAGCHVGDIGNKLNISSFCAFGESSLWSISGWDIDMVRSSLGKLSGVISVSTNNKSILINNNLFRESDIEVFLNGVDHTVFFPKDKRAIRKEYGFPEDAFIGAFTGSFNDSKGVIRAQKAAQNAGNVKMIYIGGGDNKPEGDNILFQGRLQHDKIPDYLCAADFFVLPTKAEGCCNAIIEAMACGLPIISTDGAYNTDILSESYSIMTAPEDIEAITEAIKFLHENPETRIQMGEAARKASLQFDIEKRASDIIEFMKRKKKGN